MDGSRSQCFIWVSVTNLISRSHLSTECHDYGEARSHEKRITQKIRLLLGSEILWISATPLMWKKSWITPAELPHNFYAQSIY